MLTGLAVERTVLWALKRHANDPIEQQARSIREALEVLIAADSEDEPAAEPIPLRKEPASSRLPPSPAVVGDINKPEAPKSALIISPDSEEGRAAFTGKKTSAVIPIAVDSVRRPANAGAAQRRAVWRMDALATTLETSTPATLTIQVQHPERGKVEIELERNIMCMPGVNSADAVKLAYKSPLFNDDMAVSETFWTSQRELPVEEALGKIMSAAEKLYHPRPRVIENRAQALTGSMTFDDTNPHTSTDKLYKNGTAF